MVPLKKFRGNDDDVAMEFSQGFYGNIFQIGGLAMVVTKCSLAQAMGLSHQGEQMFKNKKVEKGT